MKKAILSLFTILLVLGCSRQKQNVITGEIEGLKTGDRVYVSVEDTGSMLRIVTDSVTVTKDGEFEIKTKVTDNYIQITHLKPGEFFNSRDGHSPEVFLEGHDKLKVTGNVNDWYYIKISGGIYEHPELKEYFGRIDSAKNIQNEGLQLMEKARETQDSVLRQEALDIIYSSNDIFVENLAYEEAFIKNNPDVAYSAALLRYNYDEEDFEQYERLFAGLAPRVQATPVGMVIKSFIENTRATQVGAVAPDFTLKSLGGDVITLSEFRGKYVLIDFWGSWCGPCRQSSPMLVKLYNDLKEKNANIEFIGVACDEKNDKNWTDAIEKDKLTWIQVSDSHSDPGKSVQKLYAIDGVPTCLLISPDGEILHKEHPYSIVPKVEGYFID